MAERDLREERYDVDWEREQTYFFQTEALLLTPGSRKAFLEFEGLRVWTCDRPVHV